jgi:hypothetical protein
MRIRSATAVIALAGVVGGCATLMGGSTAQLQLTSDPPGAVARTSLEQTCTTPCAVSASRRDDVIVVFSKEGFQDQTIEVRPRPVSSGGMFGDLFGSDTELSPNPVFARLEPIRPVRPARPARKGRVVAPPIR